MKQITKKDAKEIIKDRWWSGLAIANAVMAVIVIAVIAAHIEPKETQVITHYSAYGITSFYRNYWYFLWGYALLELIIVLTHTALSLKLYHMKRRDLSLALLWATLGLSCIVLLYAVAILSIAALG
jgi:hypothetical protein